jgi:hypothetical protein
MLFKILHGDESNISLDVTPFHEGWAYVTHSGYFYVDLNIGTTESPNNQRLKLNANQAEKLIGYDITTILNSSDVEIPTSKAVLDAIDAKLVNNNTIPTVQVEGGDTVIWTGHEEAVDVGADKPYYYISNAIPTIEDCANGINIIISDDIPYCFPEDAIFVDDMGAIHAEQDEVMIINESCVGQEIETAGGYMVFPYAGVYIAEKFVDHIVSFQIPGYTGFGIRTVVDPSYIPSFFKLSTITMPASAWEGENEPYYQIVTCNGATINSKIDLQPTAFQHVELQDARTMLMIENDNGTIVAYALGSKPEVDYTMQVFITEVTIV